MSYSLDMSHWDKEAGWLSQEKTEHFRLFFASRYGVLIPGTPQKKVIAISWRSRLEAICRTVLPYKSMNDNVPINTLKSNNQTVQHIDHRFIQLSRSLHMSPSQRMETYTFMSRKIGMHFQCSVCFPNPTNSRVGSYPKRSYANFHFRGQQRIWFPPSDRRDSPLWEQVADGAGDV